MHQAEFWRLISDGMMIGIPIPIPTIWLYAGYYISQQQQIGCDLNYHQHP